MTSTEPTVVQAPDDGPWPIWSTDTLIRRIGNLTDEAKTELAEAWRTFDLPSLTETPLLTTEAFTQIEHLVADRETTATTHESSQVRGWKLRLHGLPDHITAPAYEQIRVLGGMTPEQMEAMGHNLVTTHGRLGVIREIVEAALAAQDEPSPADRQAEADAEASAQRDDEIRNDTYPGSKADIPTVKTWIGDDLNRMARAYAQELDRSLPRKRLVKFLEDGLGPDRLAQVRQAMEGSAAPPLSFAQTPVPDAAHAVGEGQEDGGATQPDAAIPASEAPAAVPLEPTPSDPVGWSGLPPIEELSLEEALIVAGTALIQAAKQLRAA